MQRRVHVAAEVAVVQPEQARRWQEEGQRPERVRREQRLGRRATSCAGCLRGWRYA